MGNKIERYTNYFGIIRFMIVFSFLLILLAIVVYCLIAFEFSNYEICMILFLPIVAFVLIPIALLAIALAHPMYMMINQDKIKLFYLIGKSEEIKFSDIENVKMNYKLNISYYPIYIKMKEEENPKSIDGIGNNIQNAIVKYSKIKNIPTEKYGYWTSSLKEN